jgi:dTDP-glucose pyrophosphorylase
VDWIRQTKTQIQKGKFIVQIGDNEYSTKVKDFLMQFKADAHSVTILLRGFLMSLLAV